MALVVAYSAKEDRDRNIGYLEAFTGLGFLTGPLVGSIMYNIGGYMMPFAACGILYTISFPFVCYNLIIARRKRIEQSMGIPV